MKLFKKKDTTSVEFLAAEVSLATTQASVAMVAFTKAADTLNDAADQLDDLAFVATAEADTLQELAVKSANEARLRRNQAASIQKLTEGSL